MPTLDEYLAMMQPKEPSQREKLMSMIGNLGVGLLSAPTWQKGLARGGLLAYDAQQGAKDRSASDQMARLQQYKVAQGMADADAQREDASKFQQQVGGVLSNAPKLGNMGPGGPTPANAAAVAPPDRVEKLRQVAELMIARGQVEGAQKLLAEADKIEGTFSVDPKVGMGASGPQFAQFSNKGRAPRVAQGFAPPPDMKAIPLGDRTELVDMLRAQPGALAAGMSPGDKAQNQLGWANNAVARQNAELQGRRLDQELSTSSRALGLQGTQAVTALRKEYNDLPAVKNYQATLPILESIQNSPDTRAGDLDMIYAVGKILDPNSVVREGEMVLVTKSGSPAQQISGYMRSLGGKGKLTPDQRTELRAMLSNRVDSLREAHDEAAAPYVRQANAAGLPADQIFGGTGGGWSITPAR